MTDFGLAKVALVSRAEASGLVSGTPAYMAPEQFRGELPSVETDIYALGYVVYVCLAGKLPIGNADPMYFHLMMTPPPIAGAPAYMNAAILKAVSKERKDRFPSALAFAEALRGATVRTAPEVRTETYALPLPLADHGTQSGSRTKISKSWLILIAALFGVILLFLSAAVLTRKSSPDTTAKSSPDSDSPTEPGALPPLPLLNPAPRIDEIPPVIESARVTRVPGPLVPAVTRPEILTRLRVTGTRVLAFGPDGTLYLTSDGSDIGAVRNGQLAWQFSAGSDTNRFTFAPDGLIWVHNWSGDQGLFCFNAAGQGGELVNPAMKAKYLAQLSKLESSPAPVECVSARNGYNGPGVERRGARNALAWRTPIDYECEQDPVVGRNGNILLQTKSRTVYLLSEAGAIRWTYPAPCLVKRSPLLLSNDTAVALCSHPNMLIGIADGQQRFSVQPKSETSGPLAERRAARFTASSILKFTTSATWH